MFSRVVVGVAMFGIAAQADFSYEQTSKMTGGAVAGAMRMAGVFSKTAREPFQSTVMVKGNRLATVSRDHVSVIDLDRETMTAIDMEKKTYATVTFAEMAEAMKRMAEKMSQNNASPGGDATFRADVKQTGATRVISGFNTKETVLTLTVDGTDKKSGQKGSMDMQMDMWIAPTIPGYSEVKDFYQRMAQKVAWNPAASALGPMMAQHAKGMGELTKEMAKLEGVPVLQITKVGIAGDGMTQTAEAPPPPAPAASDVAQTAAQTAALSKLGTLGSLAGGFGGFGRKKKPAEPEPQQASQPAGALMEMTTELTSFSSAPVDASKFEVPAGFKQVENDMKKALRN